MGKSRLIFNIVFTLLIVMAFAMARHRSTPNVPLPDKAIHSGSSLQIPVSTGTVPASGEGWLLIHANNQFFINVYHRETLALRLSSTRLVAQTAAGSDYFCPGQVEVDGALYQVQRLHLNPSQTSGTLILVPASSK